MANILIQVTLTAMIVMHCLKVIELCQRMVWSLRLRILLLMILQKVTQTCAVSLMSNVHHSMDKTRLATLTQLHSIVHLRIVCPEVNKISLLLLISSQLANFLPRPYWMMTMMMMDFQVQALTRLNSKVPLNSCFQQSPRLMLKAKMKTCSSHQLVKL